MATGRRHWSERLGRLLRVPAMLPPGYRQVRGARWLRRSERRQLRKLMGRKLGREWRIFGHGRPPADALNRAIVAEARRVGHILPEA